MIKYVKRSICIFVTICMTVCLLGYLTNVMERKNSIAKYTDFFDQKEDFDVLFMGNSHVINAVQPMELWDDYGIVSYNMGGHANHLGVTYWVMENALDYTTPKVMVIDCNLISSQTKSTSNFSYMHMSFDSFPLSLTKIKAVWDLLDDPILEENMANAQTSESSEERTGIGLLWNFSVYHSRWNELSKNDFQVSRNLEKGAQSRINVRRSTTPEKIDSSRKLEKETVSKEYLRKMIEVCQSRGIEVLLTYVPFPAPEVSQMEANYVYDLAEEYGVNYINFLDMDLVDYRIDCYDDDSHLNPSGARKVTDYIGQYLTDHYQIENRKTNPKYSSWHDDYARYVDQKNSRLTEQKNLVNYLMLLSGDKTDIVLDVRNKDLFRNDYIMELLSNIGIDPQTITENTDFIMKRAGSDKTIALDTIRTTGGVVDTEIGTVRVDVDQTTNAYTLSIDDQQYLTGDLSDPSGMGITVCRAGEQIDSVRFSYSVMSDSQNVNVSSVSRGDNVEPSNEVIYPI